MMKRRTTKNGTARLAALILCIALCLGLCGCGRDGETGIKWNDGPRFTVAIAQQPDSFNPVASEGGLAEEFFLLCGGEIFSLRSRKNSSEEEILWLLSGKVSARIYQFVRTNL